MESLEKQVMCDDISDLVYQVCSVPPQEPNSLRLPVDGDAHEAFRLLGQFLTHAIVYLYGEQVNIEKLSQTDVKLLQLYLASFGWQAVINPNLSQPIPQALPYVLKIPIPNHIPMPGQAYDYKPSVHVVFKPYTQHV